MLVTAALGVLALAAYFLVRGGSLSLGGGRVREDAVISGVGSGARQIWRTGRDRGNSAHTFTVIGDSISADARFLRPLAAGQPDLGAYDDLDATIRFFSGPDARGANPFDVPSAAVHTGWMSETVLDPAYADGAHCAAGESPLVCELRLAQPAVALILLGTNDLAGGRTPETYRANLERIVQTCIDAGTIPVLSTIPPMTRSAAENARVPDFNAVVIDLARRYEIPLWHYWLALQDVPGYGLSADGVHPNAPPDGQSTTFDAAHLDYGITVRNLTALQVLDAVRKAVFSG